MISPFDPKRTCCAADSPGSERLYPLAAVLSLERVKYAMALVHGSSLETRLPFAPLTADVQREIEGVLHALDLWQPPLASVRER